MEPAAFEAGFLALANAVDVGFGVIAYNQPTRAFADGLKQSVARFAARKSLQQARDLAALLDKNGTRRPWREFQRLAQPIVGNYNQRWLQTEYNAAVRVCRAAANWQRWEKQVDLYPNLRYTASRSATPRDEHKPWYGLVRPLNDPFWDTHLPPSAWNCKCGVEQTDAPATPVPDRGPKPAPGLDNNPGKTGDLFSLKTVNYAADQAKEAEAEGLRKQRQLIREKAREGARKKLIETKRVVQREELPGPVHFTMKGIKECINQPHKHWLAKASLVEDGLAEAMEQATYLHSVANSKPDKKPNIAFYHYFSFQLAGDPAYLIVEQNAQGKCVLHSITDSLSSLK